MRRVTICATCLAAFVSVALAQSPVVRITQPITDQNLVRLAGNVHPGVTAANDRGAAAASMPLQHMLLLLRRTDQQESSLRLLLDQQRVTGGSSYHHWLTPAQFGDAYGPAPGDVTAVENWLQSEGFSIEGVTAGRSVIEFGGTAGNVASAFHTSLHRYQINGALHWANASDPSIPAALAPVVAGVVSLNDFRAQPNVRIGGRGRIPQAVAGKPRPALTFQGSNGEIEHAMAPGDFDIIYDVNMLLDGGTDGTGETIAAVGASDADPGDYQDFVNNFVPRHRGPGLVTVLADTDPGIVQDGTDVEATLDVEWASAAAPGAQVDLVVSSGSDTTDPIDLDALYVVNRDLAPIMSVSFGLCEAQMGATENAFWNSLYAQAAAEGITALVATGDSGAAGCDDPTSASATQGLGVSGLASTPFNTAVGGTEFNEGGGSFWNASNLESNLSSAISYIPEIPWDESGLAPASLAAGGGGASSVYAKPAWQAGVGVPADAARDLPDVSLNAAAGHDPYVICFERSCASDEFVGIGGTSASTPSMAGLTALLDDQTATPQGLITPALYQLASKAPAVYHDVTSGTNAVRCTLGTPDCSGGTLGFNAAPGFDLATGWGSVDATVLAKDWNQATFAATTTTLALTPPANLTHGQSVPLSLQVAGAGGGAPPTGSVELVAQYSNGNEIAAQNLPLVNGLVAATATAALPGGTYNLVARYSGDLNYAASESVPVSLSVAAEPSIVTLSVADAISGQPVPTNTVTYGDPVLWSAQVQGVSGQGIPTGNVTYNAPNIGSSLVVAVDPTGQATLFPVPLYAASAESISANYLGDASFAASTSAPVALTINQGPTAISLANSNPGGAPTFLATITTQAVAGQPPQGNVAFFTGGQQVGTAYTGVASSDLKTGTFITTATWEPTTLPGALATVTAQYLGDNNYAASPVSNEVTAVTPANPVASVASVDFGTVDQGTVSPPQSFTITNEGGSAWAVSVSLIDETNFSQSNDCGVSLAVTAVCTVQVVFNPATAGSISSAIDVGLQVVNLTGKSEGFTLPSSLAFLNVNDGQSTQVSIAITPEFGYSGTVALACSGVPALATCSFSPASVTLDGTSPATTTLTITTTAAPGSSQFVQWGDWGAGLGLGLLALVVAWLGVPRRRLRSFAAPAISLLVVVAVSCGGGASGGSSGGGSNPNGLVPTETLSPSTLDFGAVGVGLSSASQTLTLTDTGQVNMNVGGDTILNPQGPSNDFVATSNCPSTLVPSQSCSVSVTFSPTTTVPEIATLTPGTNAEIRAACILIGVGVDHTPLGSFPIVITATAGVATATVDGQLFVN